MSTPASGRFDEAMLAALEYPAVLDKISERATCEPGRAAVLALRPIADLAHADGEQGLVEDAAAYLQAGGDISLAGAVDVSESVARARKGGVLAGVELHDIAQSEQILGRASVAIREARSSGPLRALVGLRVPCDQVVRRIDEAVEESGRLADGASPELAQIRRRQKKLHDEVRERCAAIIRKPATAKLLSEPIVTVRAGRYVVPVRAEAASQFPGVVHDQSASGGTLYVEPIACVGANNDLRALALAEEHEAARILDELSRLVAAHADALAANAALVARLDAAGARARWALAQHALRPQLTDEPALRIVNGRHPLLRREAVPLDVEVGENFDALVISGPNMGGKTVALKTVGLFCLLGFAGIPTPAGPGTRLGRFDRIVCVVGDEQSIVENLSSFSAHLRSLRAALENASSRTLVLVDEIGGGTEPAAGAALAQAFVEALLDVRARVVVTTHYAELKSFAAGHGRVANASMLFNPRTNEPTFVLALGVPGQSLAFSLARSLGFSEQLVSRAESLLGEEARELERAIAALASEREQFRERQTELEAGRRRVLELEAELAASRSELQRRRSEFEATAEAVLRRAVKEVSDGLEARAAQSLADARRQRGRQPPGAEALYQQTLSEMRRSLGLERQADDDATPLAVGDAVEIKSLGSKGIVSEIYEGDVLVTVGNLRTIVARSDLRLEARPQTPGRGSSPGDRSQMQRIISENAATTIDVRGLRVDEAVPVVDKALDDAMLAGAGTIRILHGKGTGQLARGIGEFLRGHPQVDRSAFAPEREGGTGVTVVTLR